MRRIVAVLITAATLSSIAQADILPPGNKWIAHVAKFENAGGFKDYVFYVYPRDLSRARPGNSSIRVPESGEVAISGINPIALRDGIHLFAVPRKLLAKDDTPPKEEWFTEKSEGVLKAGPLVHPVRTVSSSDKREKIVTRYKIEIKDGSMKLTEVKPEPSESKPEEEAAVTTVPETQSRWHWMIGGGFAGAALVTAVVLAVRRKV
jgi:hypothetical protein